MVRIVGAAFLIGAALAGPLAGQATERVSISSSGAQANGQSNICSFSADGRYVAFNSSASNLVIGDTNFLGDVFVRDRQSGTTERVSVSSSGAQANDHSHIDPLSYGYVTSLSADGRYVVFYSRASNLVSGDTNSFSDVFVRNRQSGTTERVSVSSSGAQANGHTFGGLSMSADGRYVAFASPADNLVSGDTNGWQDVFVRDRLSGTTGRLSISSSGAQANKDSGLPSVSADGRYVAFQSRASNLVSGDTNLSSDYFVRDRQSGTTERVNVSSSGAQVSGSLLGFEPPSISADGRYVAFASDADNLVSGDTNFFLDAFVRDRGCQLASATFRNAGSNPASFSCNAPVLGTNWAGTVNLSTTGHSFAYVYAFAAQTTSTLPQGQVLLGSGRVARFGPLAGPLANFSFAVPIDTALCGFYLTTQALHLGTVRPFATSNAMDLVVGR